MKNLKKLLWLLYFSIIVILMAHTYLLHSDIATLMDDNEKIMKEIQQLHIKTQP